MIELIFGDRCSGCGRCATICPNDVFDGGLGEYPTIARQEDCVSCYLCEAYCPADALYVSPDAKAKADTDDLAVLREGRLGSFRCALGWDIRLPGSGDRDPSPYPAILGEAGAPGDPYRTSSYAPGGANEDHARSRFAEAHPDELAAVLAGRKSNDIRR